MWRLPWVALACCRGAEAPGCCLLVFLLFLCICKNLASMVTADDVKSVLNCYLICLKDGGVDRQTIIGRVIPFAPQMPAALEPGQSQEPGNAIRVSHGGGCQGPPNQSPRLLPPRVHRGRKLELRVELGLEPWRLDG